MISPDLQFEGFDARSWIRLVSLFSPSRTEPVNDHGSLPRPSGTLVILVDERNEVLGAFHTKRGRMNGIDYGGPDDLPALCDEHSARRCIVVREGTMDEIAERLAARVSASDDYVAQCLELVRIAREAREALLLDIWPRPLSRVPIPTPLAVRRALDLLLPDGRTVLAILWDRGKPWTGFALSRTRGELDHIVGPELIQRWTGPLGGDWRRDHRVITASVNQHMPPVHIGLFAERSTIVPLLHDPSAGGWSRAVAVRDVIVQPAPPYVTVAVGADVLGAVASQAARWWSGFDALSTLNPLLSQLRNRVTDVSSMTSTLGFNPLRVLAALLNRSTDNSPDEPPK